MDRIAAERGGTRVPPRPDARECQPLSRRELALELNHRVGDVLAPGLVTVGRQVLAVGGRPGWVRLETQRVDVTARRYRLREELRQLAHPIVRLVVRRVDVAINRA